ncbi:hypothetical protein M2432_003033 [Mycobacterium sp. OTB74]|nr:hypothetical protein [Mycobacterium sp. OTB74]
MAPGAQTQIHCGKAYRGSFQTPLLGSGGAVAGRRRLRNDVRAPAATLTYAVCSPESRIACASGSSTATSCGCGR